jgi:arginyl-tRNA--protein-N-Asp/Glu arginylyltransferase
MRLLERVVEKPRACAYLPDRLASIEVRVMLDVTPTDMDALLERGWRRFGPIYFRPACSSCTECVSLRVDDARLALYAKWHKARERERGWEPNPQTRDRYAIDFAFPHPCARETAFYDDDAGGRLVGVGLFDVTPRALSAAFFFHDPDYARLSLGTANVGLLIDDARASGRAHVYLGYRVEGCASLSYKAAFRPHELLVGELPAFGEPATWREGVPVDGVP